MDWKAFTDQCHLRFGPPMSLNPLGKLANLKQIGTVEDYQKEFQSLLARTTEFTTKYQINLFTAGLTEGLQLEVELQQPGSLGAAMNLSRIYEKKQRSSQAVLGGNYGAALAWSSPKTAIGETIKGKENSLTASSTGSTNVPFFKKLTKSEMEERRAKGLCFNCDEAFSWGHQRKKLFWVELAESEEEGPGDPELPQFELEDKLFNQGE